MEQSYYRQKNSYLKRFYFLVQLKRAKMPFSDLVLFYTTCVRSVLTYALPVFHHALVKYLKVELAGIQKRALAIICPNIAYNNALDFLDIPKITTYMKLSAIPSNLDYPDLHYPNFSIVWTFSLVPIWS